MLVLQHIYDTKDNKKLKWTNNEQATVT